MRHFAITGIVTASWISLILSGSDMRATPPSRRMSAGTRSSAITAHAPAASAIFACSASTTSMITPPLSISARPPLTRIVPVSCIAHAIGIAMLARRQRPPSSRPTAGSTPYASRSSRYCPRARRARDGDGARSARSSRFLAVCSADTNSITSTR